jgi:excisionase family DNA binding protein
MNFRRPLGLFSRFCQEVTGEERMFDALLTKRELARWLRIHISTVDDWLARERVPHIKLGSFRQSRVGISKDEIERWLKESAGPKARQ